MEQYQTLDELFPKKISEEDELYEIDYKARMVLNSSIEALNVWAPRYHFYSVLYNKAYGDVLAVVTEFSNSHSKTHYFYCGDIIQYIKPTQPLLDLAEALNKNKIDKLKSPSFEHITDKSQKEFFERDFKLEEQRIISK